MNNGSEPPKWEFELYCNDPLGVSLEDCRADARAGRVVLRRNAIRRESVEQSRNAFRWRAMNYARRWQVFVIPGGKPGEVQKPFDMTLPRLNVRAGNNQLMLESEPEGTRRSEWIDLIMMDLVSLVPLLQQAVSDVLTKSGAVARDRSASAKTDERRVTRGRSGDILSCGAARAFVYQWILVLHDRCSGGEVESVRSAIQVVQRRDRTATQWRAQDVVCGIERGPAKPHFWLLGKRCAFISRV